MYSTVDGIRLESPLVGSSRDAAVLRYGSTTIRERPFLGHLNLRGTGADDRFAGSVARIVGVALPLDPNTARESAGRAVCWLCPSEWLIVCSRDDEQALADELRKQLHAQLVSVVQIGGGQTVFSFEGDGARDLLARGCPLDLDPRIFTIGQCAQTLVEKVPVLLRPVTGGLDLVVRRSFADSLWRWLESAVG